MSFIPMESPLRYVIGSTPPVYHQHSSLKTSQCTPSVFIVDGDGAVCESLALLITCEGWRLETFTSAEEFLCRPMELVPSCLMLDAFLPGISGLELQKRVTAERPGISVIFISTKCDVPTAVQAMKAGALEFFVKPFRDDILVSAIREALERSQSAVAREVRRKALKRCYAFLTRREREVMALVCSGLSNKQVGGELGISEITVKAHRGQVMQKMQASSLADLVRMAGNLSLVKRREAAVLRDHADHAGFLSSQMIGSLASVA